MVCTFNVVIRVLISYSSTIIFRRASQFKASGKANLGLSSSLFQKNLVNIQISNLILVRLALLDCNFLNHC